MDDVTDPKSVLADAFAQAPEPVQAFISSGKYEAFLEELRTAQNLHVDVVNLVSDELLMMLVGMSEPLELAENLKSEAGLTDEQTAAVIDAANREIFVPLRNSVVQPEASSPAREPLVPMPAPIASPPTPPVPVTTVKEAPPPPPVATIAPEPVQPSISSVRTMAHDVEAIKEGSAPEPVPYRAPEPLVPAPVAPTPIITPAAPAMSSPRPVVTAAPDPGEVASTLKQYGIDPYREPVE